MFDMYTSMHLLMLGIFIVYIVLFFIFKNKIYNSPKEKLIRYIYASVLSVNLVVLATIETVGGHAYLPFHLCAMSYILTIVLLFTNNEKIFRFVFFTGIIGGIVSFAIPDLYHAGYNRFRFYEFIVAHGAIIIVPIYYLTCYKYKVTKKITLVVILITNILGFLMWPINIIFRNSGFMPESNYMFTMGAPEDVETIFGPYPWHLFTFEFLIITTFFIVFFFANRYQNKTKAAL
jgi:hypothetical integral membrane protein (TIGR02206 family)